MEEFHGLPARLQRSGFTGTSAWQLSVQSKWDWFPFRPRFGGATRVASATLVAGAAVVLAPWHGSSWGRVNGAGSPSDRGLELQEGRATYYGLKKEARLEIPRQKSTISLNATVLAGAVGCSYFGPGN